MALQPHIARKAQEELDRVVGNERLPELSDREHLPYISALINELLRWSCPAPLGIPKRVMEDDVYNGYLIPAGATVFENIWYALVKWQRGVIIHLYSVQGGVLQRDRLRSTSHL